MSEAFEHFKEFICHRMRMSHIYQPVMLKHLLQNRGYGTVDSIATAILVNDPTQVEYYEHIVKRYPGPVLTNPKKDLVEKNGASYKLKRFEALSVQEIETLVMLCDEQIEGYVDSKRISPWDHRRLASGYISGSKVHEVFKQAKSRCLLCGKSEGEIALTVDHIVPRKMGGTDDLSNLQALCHRCNSRKRATDSEDFRGVADSYNFREMSCPLCEFSRGGVAAQNELSFSTAAKDPVTEGHLILAPKRHVSDYFELYQPELKAIQQLLLERKAKLQEKDQTITGYNVAVESGEDAGQSVPHSHIHLIPRRKGDKLARNTGVLGFNPEHTLKNNLTTSLDV